MNSKGKRIQSRSQAPVEVTVEELPESVVTYLRDKPEPRLVISSPEGWRHSLDDVDIDAEPVRTRSSDIREQSLERIKEGELSEGEAFFLQQAAEVKPA